MYLTLKLMNSTRTNLLKSSLRSEPTFGGINLEDIKAPECFYIEQKLRERDEYSGIPRRSARHGNYQHCRHPQRLARGGENISDVRMVVSGAVPQQSPV
ncbi:hypothetical protein DMI70_13955 [Escherichia coli]|nr:hypothetical protein [Escherichia coli]